MGQSGALFDLNKLNDVSKDIFSRMSAEEAFDFMKEWAERYGTEKQKGYFADRDFALKVLTLCMGIGSKKRRKDFVTAKQATETITYFFEAAGNATYRTDKETTKAILEAFATTYDEKDDNTVWFEKVKAVADKLGFASDMKAYKANPENYKGNVSDVAEVIRIAVTGLANTPDLCTLMKILGQGESLRRIALATEKLA
jgi:glutamyl-tRNA synthetase